VNGSEVLFISIVPISESFPNAKAMMDFELSRSEQLSDFKLLKRSAVTMAGTNVERIIYSYFGFRSSMESYEETGTAYEAYFDSEEDTSGKLRCLPMNMQRLNGPKSILITLFRPSKSCLST